MDPDALFAPPPPPPTRIQREHDSLDDFEHLDHDAASPARRPVEVADMLSLGDDGPPPPPPHRDVRSFLDTEREEMLISAPHIEDNLFSDGREELSPAPSDDSMPDAMENFASPSSPARAAAAQPAPPPPPVSALPDPIVPRFEPSPPKELPKEPPKPTPPPPAVEKPATPPPPPPVREVQPQPPKEVQPPPPKEVQPPPPPPKASVQPTPPSTTTQQRPAMEAEVIFCQMGLDAWFNPGRLHPKVESLVYWRSPARSGIALGAGLVLLLALACCSLISVLAYTSLLLLTATTAFRIYSSVLQAIQKTSDGHPFKDLLDTDLSISPERAQELATLATAHMNGAAKELRRLFLVEDLVDSLKFGVMLWCLTYLGAWFNGMTLLIIGYVALFTLPKIYETNKAQIDANLDLVSGKFQEITNKVKAAIPIGKKGESEKDK